MENKSGNFSTIDEYISGFSPEIQERLMKLRDVIRSVAPDATEKISYQLPTFFLNGNLVHFGAFKNHIGLYPGADGTSAFQAQLSKYKNSKGAIQFQNNEPIPYDLIAKIVEYRVKVNISKKGK